MFRLKNPTSSRSIKVDSAKSVANDKLQVTIASIIQRSDWWSKKVNNVKHVLSNLCKGEDIPLSVIVQLTLTKILITVNCI